MVSRRIGGAALMAMALARAASRRGWPGITWVPGPGPASERVAREGLKHRVIGLDATHTAGMTRLVTSARLFAALVRERRAVVHVHDSWMWGLVRPALLRAGARSVVHVNLELNAEEIAWTLKHPPAHIVTCARYIAAQIRTVLDRRGLDIPVTAIPNAIDIDRFQHGDRQAARQHLGLGAPESFIVLMLANLAPHKGQATAIRALRTLREQGVRAECWIVGEDRSSGGNYLRSLRTLAAELEVTDHIRFLGFRHDAGDLLRAADAFVLPSTHEGLPFSVLEAQAAGVPVIASNIPGVLEVVEDGTTGFVVPPDDFAGYADRLRLLSREQDVGHRLARAASERVRREHVWPRFEDRMFEVYASMCGDNRAVAP
jgi:glycosyltransferase involved in cell wall biosynthesis